MFSVFRLSVSHLIDDDRATRLFVKIFFARFLNFGSLYSIFLIYSCDLRCDNAVFRLTSSDRPVYQRR